MVRAFFWFIIVLTLFPLNSFASHQTRLCPFLVELNGGAGERIQRYLARIWGVDTGLPSLCPTCSVPNFQSYDLTATIPQAEANGATPIVTIGEDDDQRPTVEFTVSTSVAESALDQAVRATIESASTGGAAAAYNAQQEGPVTEESMRPFCRMVVDSFRGYNAGTSTFALDLQNGGRLTQLAFVDYGPSGTLVKTYFRAKKNRNGTVHIVIFPLTGMTSVSPSVLADKLRQRLPNLSATKGLIYASKNDLNAEGPSWRARMTNWLQAVQVSEPSNTSANIVQNYATQMKRAAIASWWQERVAHPLIKSDPKQRGINSTFLWELTNKIEGLDVPWPELVAVSKGSVQGKVAVPLTSLQDLAKLIGSAPGPKNLKDQLVAAFETQYHAEMAKPSPILIQTMIPTLFRFNGSLGVILKPVWGHRSKFIAKFAPDGSVDLNADNLPDTVEIEMYVLGEGFSPESQVGMIHSLLEHLVIAP